MKALYWVVRIWIAGQLARVPAFKPFAVREFARWAIANDKGHWLVMKAEHQVTRNKWRQSKEHRKIR